jgi:bifunctional non-homologous end joining protein LigD
MILDGEIVALDEKGRPSFNALQNYRPRRPVQFYAFDLLAYKGKDLLKRPLEERRVLLERAVGSLPGAIRISETFESDPETLAGAAQELGLEGVIAKRRDSLYEPGLRTGAWVKLRVNKGQELVIGGYIPAGDSFDSLLVGYYEKGQLLFIAKVRNGFVPASRRRLLEAFKGLETAVCPFANLPEPKSARRGRALTREEMRKCEWLQPKLVAQIEFTDWTEDDHLRHSRFVGLRRDKRALDVRRELAE